MIDSLSNATYLSHLNQHELMTAKEELELVRFVQKGCHNARTEFIPVSYTHLTLPTSPHV